MILYHVSPKKLKYIDPNRSEGAYAKAWLCDLQRLPWTVNHIAERRKIGRSKLWIHVVSLQPHEFHASGRPGVFLTPVRCVVRLTGRSA